MAFSLAQMVPIQCSHPHVDRRLQRMPHRGSLCLTPLVTPFSTSLASTPLHAVVSLQSSPKRTAFSWLACSAASRQKSIVIGEAESSSLFLLSRVVSFPVVPMVTALGHPHQNLSPGIPDQPQTGLPSLGLPSPNPASQSLSRRDIRSRFILQTWSPFPRLLHLSKEQRQPETWVTHHCLFLVLDAARNLGHSAC